APPDAHGPETCNGVDDDGNGQIDEIGCADLITQFSGHAYMTVHLTKSASSAGAHCASFGYHLVTIDDVKENDFIKGLVKSMVDAKGGDPSSWIGFNDRDREGTFVWDDGSTSVFTNWSSGQPDNFFDEDCAILQASTLTGAWIDIDCEDSRSFVCEAGRRSSAAVLRDPSN